MWIWISVPNLIGIDPIVVPGILLKKNMSNSNLMVALKETLGDHQRIGGGFILREPLRSFQRFIVIHKSIPAWTKLIDRLAKPLAWLRICELQEILQFWQHQALWGAHIANRQALKPCTVWESTAFVNYKGDVIPNYCTHKACTVRTFAPHPTDYFLFVYSLL